MAFVLERAGGGASYAVTGLGTHGGMRCLAKDINVAGHAAGYVIHEDEDNDTLTYEPCEAVLWSDGVSIGLGTLPGDDRAIASGAGWVVAH